MRLDIPATSKTLPESLKNCPDLKLVTKEDALEHIKGLAKAAAIDCVVSSE